MSHATDNIQAANETSSRPGAMSRSLRAFAAFTKVAALRLPAKTPEDWAVVGAQLISAVDACNDDVAPTLLKRHGPPLAREVFREKSALALCAGAGLLESVKALLPFSDPLATHRETFWDEPGPSTALFDAIKGRNVEAVRLIAPLSNLLHERMPGQGVFWRASALMHGFSAVDHIVGGPMFIALMDESLRQPPEIQAKLFMAALEEINDGLDDRSGMSGGVERHGLVDAFVQRVPGAALGQMLASFPKPLRPELRAPLSAKHEAWALAQVVAEARASAADTAADGSQPAMRSAARQGSVRL